jgi:hypothetical protein
MAGYYPLPAYNPGNALNFEPLSNAVSGFKEAQSRNALLGYQQQRDQVSDQRHNALLNIQQQTAERQQKQFDAEQEQQALQHLAGVHQMIEAAPEAERAALYQRFQPVYDRLRPRFKDFDSDLSGAGYDPRDFAKVGPLISGWIGGYKDPLETQKTQAEINLKNAQAGYYNERPRTAAGGATTALIDRLMQENPGMSLEEAITIAKRGSGYMEVGNELVNRNTGQTSRDISGAIAGAERAKVEGKATGETAAAMPKLEMGFNAFNQKSDRLLGVIDRAISRVGPNTTGWGGLLSTLPGTEARALSTDLDTIKANVGFEELQAMRDASPTGGALGQVSEQENRLLQAIRGSLDQLNSGQNLAENLRIVRESVAQLKALKAQQFDADRRRVAQPQGQTAPVVAPPQEPSGPAPGTVMDGYRFKGGNPADPNSWEKQ